MRLPSDFVEDVRREAVERGVTLGRVVTDRAKWLQGGTAAHHVQGPRERVLVESHEHDFKYTPSISRRRCECGEVQR